MRRRRRQSSCRRHARLPRGTNDQHGERLCVVSCPVLQKPQPWCHMCIAQRCRRGEGVWGNEPPARSARVGKLVCWCIAASSWRQLDCSGGLVVNLPRSLCHLVLFADYVQHAADGSAPLVCQAADALLSGAPPTCIKEPNIWQTCHFTFCTLA